MKLIPLTKGKFAMVDDDDFERLSKFKWRCLPSGKQTYVVTTVTRDGKRRTLYMQRAILDTNAKRIDHKDGDGLNNQKSNLRPCTPVENGRNRKLQAHSSKFKGVHHYRANGKWQAYLQVDHKKVHLGYFEREIDAAMAYDLLAPKFYGEFATTNRQLGAL